MSDLNGVQGAVTDAAPPASGDGLKITFKKSSWQNIEIDMDLLTWGDSLELIQYREKALRGELTPQDAAQILSDVIAKVTGFDPKTLPTHVVNQLAAAIWDNVDGKTDRGN